MYRFESFVFFLMIFKTWLVQMKLYAFYLRIYVLSSSSILVVNCSGGFSLRFLLPFCVTLQVHLLINAPAENLAYMCCNSASLLCATACVLFINKTVDLPKLRECQHLGSLIILLVDQIGLYTGLT